MTQPINAQNVESLIQNDIATCKALLELLDKEQEALKKRDSDELAQILENKAPYLASLEQSAQTRNQWAQASTPEDAPDAWKKMLNELKNTEVKTLWSSLKELFEQCKIKNEVNGKMLIRNQQAFGRLLDILRGQNTAKNLYNAAGESSGGSRSQIVGKA